MSIKKLSKRNIISGHPSEEIKKYKFTMICQKFEKSCDA